jgi:hypothetical protein
MNDAGAADVRRSGSTEEMILASIQNALDLPAGSLDRVRFEGEGHLAAAFPVRALASATIGAAALAVSELLSAIRDAPSVVVDRRLSGLWFGQSLRPIGWAPPPPWDPIAGDYGARDGWVRLHTNVIRHRAAALKVLACAPERSAVAEAVKAWSAEALEDAVVAGGGCAATMRSVPEWAAHPQGRAVSAEPLIAFSPAGAARAPWRPTAARPLAGVKVLDLTRVLAGPVATRFLAGYGAEVLRIDPPDWDEPGVEPEVTLGKRCARLDLLKSEDRGKFERLLAEADLLVHGYRPGALDGLKLNEDARRALRPGLIEVGLDAYGWTGPWRGRRGFDSLVQMSSGIAAAGMEWRGADRPTPLPVQALDHAAGYLMAAAAVRALLRRLRDGEAVSARVSLARTAALLIAMRGAADEPAGAPAGDPDYLCDIEATGWGPAHRARPPAVVSGAPMAWDRPADRLGSALAAWSGWSASSPR